GEGSADGALSADRRCGDPHRTASCCRRRRPRVGPGTVVDSSRAPGPEVNAFDAFAAKKTAEAEAAVIRPLTTAFAGATDDMVAIGNDWTRRMFDGGFYVSPPVTGNRPAASLVFVRSRDGNTVAPDPATLGGGEADKHLIYEGLSRVAADAVL